MKALPTPTGPWRVGTVACELVDTRRPAHLLSQDSGRTILVKCWYPADIPVTEAQRRELLEQQLRTEPNVPPLLKLFLRPAMKIATNAHHAAPYAANAGPPRVSIYNHALISFASENCTLMEHLANHGHVVIALQHGSQLAELRALQAAQRTEEKQEQAQLERRITAAAADDAEITKTTIPGTKHLNFHDISVVFPRVLRWLNAIGPADPATALAEWNRLVADFLNAAGERP